MKIKNPESRILRYIREPIKHKKALSAGRQKGTKRSRMKDASMPRTDPSLGGIHIMRHLGCYDFHRLHGSYTRCYSIVGSVILRRLLFRILSNACSLPRYTRLSVRIWDIGQKNDRPNLHTYQWCGRSNMHTAPFLRSFPVSAV